MSRLATFVVVSSLIAVASGCGRVHANTPAASELAKLNGRIAKVSGIRVITATGVFEGRGAWLDSAGLHLAETHRQYDDSTRGGPDVMPWEQVSEVRIRRSHAREGALILGSVGAVVYGAGAAFASGFAEPSSPGLTLAYTAGGIVGGGLLGGAIGGVLGLFSDGWKTIWKDGRTPS